MNILLIDDCGNKQEFLDVDPSASFIPSEHSDKCRECGRWTLEAIEDERGRFYCSPECYGTNRVERKKSWR